MKIEEKISFDMINAMKEKNKIKVSTLRGLKSKIKEKSIEKNASLDEKEILKIIKSAEKQRIDSAIQFKKGNREDLEKIELEELKIIQEYLPKQLSRSELYIEIDKVVKTLNVNSSKDIGKVMAELMKKLSGKADGKLLQELVREKLGN
ncbi:MAG: glutamyl-tRNA amidotransferase [Candidatus Marinimicrobia bacterium]|nr:glutamyl-tRNA amidotransferase [Candidatus Neomarinimicrobiota bacterium]|tara:strand:+ start:2755 stop:3201 length:447 start_codon:yes stop_codon:yes gene_type:complete